MRAGRQQAVCDLVLVSVALILQALSLKDLWCDRRTALNRFNSVCHHASMHTCAVVYDSNLSIFVSLLNSSHDREMCAASRSAISNRTAGERATLRSRSHIRRFYRWRKKLAFQM